MEKIYYPYPAKDGIHKYYIITKSGEKVYFGQYGASDFTLHKDEARKNRYILRHEKNESKFWNKSGIDTASFGVGFTSCPIQPNKKHINILRNAFYYIFFF